MKIPADRVIVAALLVASGSAVLLSGCSSSEENGNGVQPGTVQASFDSPDPRGRIAAARAAANGFGGGK